MELDLPTYLPKNLMSFVNAPLHESGLVRALLEMQVLFGGGLYLRKYGNCDLISRECVRNLDLRVQVHPRELWVSKQRVHIVLEA